MNLRNFALAGLAAGIMYFLLSWLLYGILFIEQTKTSVSREPDTLVMRPLALGNLTVGFLLAYILGKANVKNAVNGMVMGTVFDFLVSLGFDYIMYSTTTPGSLTQIAYDVAIFTAMSSLTGAGVGFVLGWHSAKETAAAT